MRRKHINISSLEYYREKFKRELIFGISGSLTYIAINLFSYFILKRPISGSHDLVAFLLAFLAPTIAHLFISLKNPNTRGIILSLFANDVILTIMGTVFVGPLLFILILAPSMTIIFFLYGKFPGFITYETVMMPFLITIGLGRFALVVILRFLSQKNLIQKSCEYAQHKLVIFTDKDKIPPSIEMSFNGIEVSNEIAVLASALSKDDIKILRNLEDRTMAMLVKAKENETLEAKFQQLLSDKKIYEDVVIDLKLYSKYRIYLSPLGHTYFITGFEKISEK